MSITEYMTKYSLSYRDFAEKCGVSASMIYRLSVGERGKQLSLSIAQAIIKGSKGEITIEALLENFQNSVKRVKQKTKK